jgi:hypothetical protein
MAKVAMRKREDYVAGPHNFWSYFIFGFIFGGAIGTWISWGLFDNYVFGAVTVGGFAFVMAYASGRWGDSAWEWMAEKFWWLF